MERAVGMTAEPTVLCAAEAQCVVHGTVVVSSRVIQILHQVA